MICAHYYIPSAEACYDVCAHCGTYRSTNAPPAPAIYTPDYWSHERGHSTIEEQVYNCETHEENGVTKNRFLLDRIRVPNRGSALEIGCAPGAMLKRLREDAGFERVVGIDMRPEWEYPIRRVAGRDGAIWDGFLFFGPFPWVTEGMALAPLDLIVAADVLEHSHEPIGFLAECARLLKPGGQLLLMLPLAGTHLNGTRFFQPDEHVFLHSASNLCQMIEAAGFDWHGTKIDSWCMGHDTVSAWRTA